MQKPILKQNINKLFLFISSLTTSFFWLTSGAHAECVDMWIPDVIQGYICNPNPEMFAESRIRALFIIAVGIIMLVAIAMALKMSFKLITSGGKEDKQQEAFDGIKAIFLGIMFIFVIMLAIPITLGFFGFNYKDMTSGMLICVRAPQSAGCYACLNKNNSIGDVNNASLCSICDKNPNAAIPYPVTDQLNSGTIQCTQTLN